tara:strand:+ start:3949 stop:5091 length:1143 start_codon:yes stop_codon:yes gene_type:complete
VKFETAVVNDIVLDTSSKFFTDAGEWNGIGTVAFQKVKGGTYKSNGFAKPYFPNFINYPLINELIYIFKLPSSDVQKGLNQENYYYISPINIWSDQHHNAIPNIIERKDIPEGEQRDYIQTQAGSVKKVIKPAILKLGEYFTENPSIKPLKKFEGDVLIESRVGSSIRFGTTVRSKGKALSNWSTGSFNGDPITIIRNGQGEQGQVAFLPTEENINNDNSSIYLTSGQQIPLEVSSTREYLSYKKIPQPIKEYSRDQILLNSGRLVFNSNIDSIMLSSAQSINLNSDSSVNIDTPELNIQSDRINLGSKGASEPALYGDLTVEVLISMVDALEGIIEACTIADADGKPIKTLQALTLYKSQISRLKDILPSLKSETVYVD